MASHFLLRGRVVIGTLQCMTVTASLGVITSTVFANVYEWARHSSGRFAMSRGCSLPEKLMAVSLVNRTVKLCSLCSTDIAYEWTWKGKRGRRIPCHHIDDDDRAIYNQLYVVLGYIGLTGTTW